MILTTCNLMGSSPNCCSKSSKIPAKVGGGGAQCKGWDHTNNHPFVFVNRHDKSKSRLQDSNHTQKKLNVTWKLAPIWDEPT